ncbi:unnamed protein product [Dibothriocephalus latus]|uniref:Alpha-(1,6)-fucosyltransferase N- and catalytic domain-containing protein n=1 Tax=Dibothriocephalus latus TaxID=60516 RepID=A0A3P6RQG6_DIBLA|nr:unnamed protein product [Dibothriocephalus latus]
MQNMWRGMDGKAYDGPIAAIHIRRSDKIMPEAKSHAVAEYMFNVERFFDMKEAESDFLIGTGSSNICRLAYVLASLKSQIQGDAAFQWQSVDEMNECSFSRKRWWRAIADFKQEAVKLGDHVSILSTQWVGFVQTAWSLYRYCDTVLPA